MIISLDLVRARRLRAADLMKTLQPGEAGSITA